MQEKRQFTKFSTSIAIVIFQGVRGERKEWMEENNYRRKEEEEEDEEEESEEEANYDKQKDK